MEINESCCKSKGDARGQPLKNFIKEITFDGKNFWFRDQKLGEISNEWHWKSPVPIEIMRWHKLRLIQKIIA